jgi:hypothetical protein
VNNFTSDVNATAASERYSKLVRFSFGMLRILSSTPVTLKTPRDGAAGFVPSTSSAEKSIMKMTTRGSGSGS